MKKILFAVAAMLLMSSCATKYSIIPKAVNTISTVSYSDLDLKRADYEIIKTITATATINYSVSNNGQLVDIDGVDDNFALRYIYKGGLKNAKSDWMCKYAGVLKLGFLSNDYAEDYDPATMCSPEKLARHLAIYRAINAAKHEGGDGLIEPVISTNVEQAGRILIYKSTVTAKVIKLKTDSEL